MPGTPFDNVSFGPTDVPQPLANTSQDDVLRLLLGTTPAQTPYTNQPVQGGTQSGIDRVNSDTSNTGVIAYKDDKGQAVLTNVAANPLTGKDEQLPVASKQVPALLKASAPQGPGVFARPDISNDLLSTLSKLRGTTDVGAANALFDSFQQTAISQKTAIEQEAFQFAEKKLGIPQLQANLDASRRADQADPNWYPGIGDSPITIKALAEVNGARQMADNEAKNYLIQNGTYQTLMQTTKSAETEYNRVKTFADRKELSEFQKNLANDTRNAAKQDDIETKLLDAYDGLSNTQLARINILQAGDLAGFTGDDKDRKLKTMRLVLQRSKDKNWNAAISAESTEQLLDLALTGNSPAKTLVMSEEAATMGISTAQVEDQLKQLQSRLADPKLPAYVFGARPGMDPKTAKKETQAMEAMLGSRDPNKKIDVNAQRLALLREDMDNRKTTAFINDVATWGSIDPVLNAAIDRAKKTTGNGSIPNVLAAYLDTSTDQERLGKAQAFSKLLDNAAAKQKGSVLGVPRTDEAKRIIATLAVEGSWWRKAFGDMTRADEMNRKEGVSPLIF